MRTRSLRLRLFLFGAAAIAGALALAGFVLVLLFEHHVERTMDDDIETYVRQLVSDLAVDSDGRLRVITATPDPRFARFRSGFYWQVAGGDSRDVERSASLGEEALEISGRCESGERIAYHRLRGPWGNALLGGERCVALGGAAASRLRVLVALDLSGVARARDAFAAELFAALLLIAIGLAFATWIQVGLGLAPLAGLGVAVSEIAKGRRRRLDSPAPPEVWPLIDEVNGLLDERDKEIERARNRAADLAHGLKTPLTALAADARLLREKGETEIARSLDRIGDAMHRHVARELARARSRGVARGGEPTPVAEVVDALARTLASAGTEARFEMRIAPKARIAVDRVDLMEILGNLMENAARHARERIRISFGGGLFIVEDDGPGLPEGSEALIRRRGGRLDETGGAGLGLAIVQDVLDAYGADMRFSRSALGGLRVEVDLSGAAEFPVAG
ncbi:signal transduction histidine kinase [Methylosinus sp. sav-2]|uniref:ATP-binding protein n=1 Tax=Methylosinus sp. sav-2 TaxID=2485168 RepID=UPI00047D3E46|nr:ATP-binding protein [Methylosinus sp. sav-2]TDX65559.1 signal transduction histidine kinase [Methylosinus sp. sav-2]